MEIVNKSPQPQIVFQLIFLLRLKNYTDKICCRIEQNIKFLKFQVLLSFLVNTFHISRNKHYSEFSQSF